jgi:hypothetical protein
MRNVAMSRTVLAVLAAGAVLVALPAQAVAQGAGPFQFHSLTPCRLADTRLTNPANPPAGGGSLSDGVTRKFKVQGWCGVPVGAKAAALNVTAVAAGAGGHLRLFPAGAALPGISTVNFNAGEPAIANGAIVPLADQSAEPLDLSVFARVPGATIQLVLDVTGYFQ